MSLSPANDDAEFAYGCVAYVKSLFSNEDWLCPTANRLSQKRTNDLVLRHGLRDTWEVEVVGKGWLYFPHYWLHEQLLSASDLEELFVENFLKMLLLDEPKPRSPAEFAIKLKVRYPLMFKDTLAMFLAKPGKGRAKGSKNISKGSKNRRVAAEELD